MADIVPHYCSACGDMHGGTPATNPEIEIARINAERDVKVAEMTRGEFKPTSAELQTQVEVAQIEADAQVGSAEAIGDALAPAGGEVPVELDAVTDVPELEEEGEEAGEPEPPEVTSSPTPREPKKATHWGAYR